QTDLPPSTTESFTQDATGTTPGASTQVNQWAEARAAYPIYAALAKQFGLTAPPHPEGEVPPEKPTREIFEGDLQWLDELDANLKAFQIRQLPPATLNANEEGLRAFIHRQLRKSDKTDVDRDKIDLLMVQYFALCAPESMYHEEISLEDVGRVLQPVIANAELAPLDWCSPLESILNTA